MRDREVRAEANPFPEARRADLPHRPFGSERRVADDVGMPFQHGERLIKGAAVRQLHRDAWVRLDERREERGMLERVRPGVYEDMKSALFGIGEHLMREVERPWVA